MLLLFQLLDAVNVTGFFLYIGFDIIKIVKYKYLAHDRSKHLPKDHELERTYAPASC